MSVGAVGQARIIERRPAPSESSDVQPERDRGADTESSSQAREGASEVQPSGDERSYDDLVYRPGEDEVETDDIRFQGGR